MPPKNISKITKSALNAKSRKSRSTAAPALKKAISAAKSANMVEITATASAKPATQGESEPVYFWKPNQDNGYLGQWYESEWTHEGDVYVTAEMWMMVQKARLFEDEVIAKAMLETTDPKAHKALGRKVQNFDEKTWNTNKRRIVEEGTYLKFTVSKNANDLKTQLLQTGERELVEASPLDRIWGIGFGAKNAGKNRDRWGQNLLGKALMEVRKRLTEESN